MNTSVQEVDIGSKREVVMWYSVEAYLCGVYICVCTCVCVMCVSGNDLDDAGITAVAEALKVNTSAQDIGLSCEWYW